MEVKARQPALPGSRTAATRYPGTDWSAMPSRATLPAMTDQDWLTLRQAARRSGYRKKVLLALVERGQVPAVRRAHRWLIAPADLAHLRPAATPSAPAPGAPISAAPGAGETRAAAEAQGTVDGRGDLTPLLDALRARDEQIARLQEERARMAGQIGFLQGLLVEREVRLRVLEALPATHAEPPVAATPVVAASTPDVARATGPDGAIIDGDSEAQPVAMGAAIPEAATATPMLSPATSAVPSSGQPALPASTTDARARRPRTLLLMQRFLGRRG